ncbi:MAG TPA: Crp/Fnr family transcriptional regulator [Solirubrobacter sp.]|nr:Crp/Fnr family transcriptional regulator [Solirubrobacter sp.]
MLELDSDLGQLLTDERRAAAERELRVRVTTFPIGEWDGGRLADADPSHIGLLIAEGVLAREVVLEDTVSTELLGPGDIVRPWHLEGPPQLLAVTIRWNALTSVRLGLIDRRVAAALVRYPEITAVIVDRMSERAQRLTITQAISQLNRVDRRLLALFWHLAERWGRVSRDGIAVPLVLSHRLIGELVGARRPTVSTALAELARDGQLVRRDDGTWLLTGEPVDVPPDATAEVIRQRRRLMPTPTGPDPAFEIRPMERLSELQRALDAARAAAEEHRRNFDLLLAETAALRERRDELRRQRTEHLRNLREAARR